MKVFLTGGSGFVGQAVRARLARLGIETLTLLRPSSKQRRRPAPLRPNEAPVVADPFDTETLAARLQGVDALIHLAGIISEVGDQTFERVHRDLARSMATVARDAGIPRFLHMSALGTRPEAPSRYHQSKWEGEESVRSSELAWTIFRPSIIYGPGDQFSCLFARMARFSPVIPLIGDGSNLLQPIHVNAVAQAFVAALDKPDTASQVFDLCGPERLTFREATLAILRAAGRPRPLLPIPVSMARAQAAALERLFPLLLRKAPPLNRSQIQMLQEDNVGEPAAANAAFGLIHVPFEEGLRATFASG